MACLRFTNARVLHINEAYGLLLIMGLYPNLDEEGKILAFSAASKLNTGFETINDKVLREMNERARIQLSNQKVSNENIFSIGQPAFKKAAQSSPQKSPRRFKYTSIYRKQQPTADSIISHPKVKAMNSRQNLRKGYKKESPGKRIGEDKDESPSKRLKQTATKAIPRSWSLKQTPTLSTVDKQATKSPLKSRISVSRAEIPLKESSKSTLGSVPRFFKSSSKLNLKPVPVLETRRTLRSSQSRASLKQDSFEQSSTIPSYARPTQSALRHSQSTQSLRRK